MLPSANPICGIVVKAYCRKKNKEAFKCEACANWNRSLCDPQAHANDDSSFFLQNTRVNDGERADLAEDFT